MIQPKFDGNDRENAIDPVVFHTPHSDFLPLQIVNFLCTDKRRSLRRRLVALVNRNVFGYSEDWRKGPKGWDLGILAIGTSSANPKTDGKGRKVAIAFLGFSLPDRHPCRCLQHTALYYRFGLRYRSGNYSSYGLSDVSIQILVCLNYFHLQNCLSKLFAFCHLALHFIENIRCVNNRLR
jgi:hypothetical protein